MYKILHTANKLVDTFVFSIAFVMFLYSLWSFSDISTIYSEAESDNILYNENGEIASLTELQKINSDIQGKLIVYDTGIDYPYVQSDNNFEYLNKDINGKNRVSGSIFIDCLNKNDFSDSYTLFYGHRMKSSVMFSDIGEFVEEDYFNNHTKGYIETNDKSYQIRFFACMKTDTSDSLIFDVEVGNEKYASLIDHIVSDSVQYRDIGVDENSRIVGLSTCENSDSNGRIILFGVLIEI